MARRDARLAGGLAGAAGLMLAASFAAVPFYDWFCRVTGYGGATAEAAAPSTPAGEATVTVRFDANVAPGSPMIFRPAARKMQVRVGENALAFYLAENPTDAPITGAASYNVTPYSAGGYFAKLACFCFEAQTLGPGERVEMPVSFFVDPAMLEDRETKGVRHITLSYTMHPVAPTARAGAARLAAAPGARPAIRN